MAVMINKFWREVLFWNCGDSITTFSKRPRSWVGIWASMKALTVCETLSGSSHSGRAVEMTASTTSFICSLSGERTRAHNSGD